MSLTSSMTEKQKVRVAGVAVSVAIGTIGTFAIFGQFILAYLHISLEALRVSGGLLLLLIAMQLVAGKEEEMQSSSKVNVGLVPLGIPLMAGPGAIVAMMVFAQKADSLGDKVSIAIAGLSIALATFLIMSFSNVVARLLGEGGVTLITRIAGVMLAAISVQMIADGIYQFLQDWQVVPVAM